jgi:adenine-specific DNA-methyltransferase
MSCYFCNLNKDINIENKKQYNFDISKNYLIKGDNLDILNAMQDVYKNKIKLIYIDPPYNTKITRNYKDKFTHQEYLDFMLARDLLCDDGVIFVQIDDNEQAYLKVLMDEIFGRDNFVGTIVWDKCNAQNDVTLIQKNHEYILCYKKLNINKVYQKEKITKKIHEDRDGNLYYKGASITTGGDGGTLNSRHNLGYSVYYNKITKDFKAVSDYDKNLAKTCNDEKEVYNNCQNTIAQGYTEIIRPPKKNNKLGCWTWKIERFQEYKKDILVYLNSNNKYAIHKKEYVKFNQSDNSYYKIKESRKSIKSIVKNISSNQGTRELKEKFKGVKPTTLIEMIIELVTSEGDIVLDFFAGSGTTPAVAHKMNRRWIAVEQMDYIENITKERLKKVINGEQGGISKDVSWQGGGEFVYFDFNYLL